MQHYNFYSLEGDEDTLPSFDNPPSGDIPKQVPDDNTDLEEINKSIDEQEAEINQILRLQLFSEIFHESEQDPAVTHMGLRLGYLNTATHAFYPSIESLDPQAIEVARDDLKDEVKNKTAGWLGRIGATLKATGSALVGFIGKQISRVTALAGKATTGIKDVVTAHPVATVLSVLAAAAGLGAAMPAILRLIPTVLSAASRLQAGISAATKAEFFTKQYAWVVSQLNSIFAKLATPLGTPGVASSGKGFQFTMKEAAGKFSPQKASSAALGWSKSAVQAVKNKLTALGSLAPNLTKMASDQVTGDVAEVSSLFASGNKVKGALSLAMKLSIYIPILKLVWEVIKAAFRLVKTVIWGACKLVTTTFSALVGKKDSDDSVDGGEHEV